MMKIRIVSLFLFSILLLGLIGCTSASPGPADPSASAEPSAEPGPLTGKTIVLDAGHGGHDDGVSGVSNVPEAPLNLAIVLELKEQLASMGANVVLTRVDEKALYPDDTPLGQRKISDFKARRKVILDAEPDAVISIHCNKFPNDAVAGAQVFYQRAAKKGQSLAACLQSAIAQEVDSENRRVPHPEDYYILRIMPEMSALIECGFLSNIREDQLLQTKEYQQKLARAMAQGLLSWFAIPDEGPAASPGGTPVPSGTPEASPLAPSPSIAADSSTGQV